MHMKFYGLQAPRAADCHRATPIPTDVWLETELPSTHIVKNRFDTKVHIYAFITIILNDTNKINTF